VDRGVTVRGLTVEIPGRTLLNDISVSFEAGRCYAVMGPSGSGKTTFLNCLAGITLPTRGSVLVNGVDVTALKEAARADFRLRSIGMVFQYGELLPELTVLENIALPLRFQGQRREEAYERAGILLERLGLQDKADQHPDILSGGETQRVAIARALVTNPSLILADEPTGMLDEANAIAVTTLLVTLGKELNATVIIATHDPRVACAADRVLRLREGKLVEGQFSEESVGKGSGACSGV